VEKRILVVCQIQSLQITVIRVVHDDVLFWKIIATKAVLCYFRDT